MNADCPVCGAEGASAENCAKYIKPADDAAVQPEGEVSDPQPETALTALIGGSETVTEVSTADDLAAAIADSAVDTVRLAGDISISSSLTVTRTVTLDLNGHVVGTHRGIIHYTVGQRRGLRDGLLRPVVKEPELEARELRRAQHARAARQPEKDRRAV